MYMFITEKQIINQWACIYGDSYYPCPEIKDPIKFIDKIKSEGVVMGVAKIVLAGKTSIT